MSRVGDHRTLRTDSTPFMRRAARGPNGDLFPVQELISVRARKVDSLRDRPGEGRNPTWVVPGVGKKPCVVYHATSLWYSGQGGGLKGKVHNTSFLPFKALSGKVENK